MSVEAIAPAKIIVNAPIRTNSYLSEDSFSRVFHWAFSQADADVKGRPVRLHKGYEDATVFGWSFIGTGSHTVDYVNKYTTFISAAATPNSYIEANPLFINIINEISDNNIGNTIEVVLNTVTSDGSVCFKIDDGTYSETVSFFEDKVTFVNTGKHYSVDTTVEHKYTISLKDDVINLYVDDIICMSETITNVSSGTKTLLWGHIGSASASESNWKSIAYYSGAFVPVDLSLVTYELQVDTVSTFNSVNLKTYLYNSGITGLYADGVVTGYVISIPPRQLDDEVDYYWRVKVAGSTYTSAYTSVQTFTLNSNTRKEIFKTMYDAIPDDNAYDKDTESGIIADILQGQAKTISELDFNILRTNYDLVFGEVRDSIIGSSVGKLLGVNADAFNNAIEYRDFLKNAAIQYFNVSRTASVKEVVKIITGAAPEIVEQYKKTGWRIHRRATSPAVKYSLRDTTYPEVQPIAKLYSSKGKAFIWEIHIFNPYDYAYDMSLVRDLIYLFKPAHTRVHILFYNSDGSVYMMPSYYGIDFYGLGYYTDKDIHL